MAEVKSRPATWLRDVGLILVSILLDRTVNYKIPTLVPILPYAWLLVLLWLTRELVMKTKLRGFLLRWYLHWTGVRRMFVYGVVFVVIGALGCVYLFAISKVLDNRQELAKSDDKGLQIQIQEQNKKLDEQTKKLDETQRKLDEISKLLKEQNPNATPENLKKQYSHGYVIGQVNPRAPALEYATELLGDNRVDWSVAYAKDLRNGEVELRLPDIFQANMDVNIHDTIITFPKKRRAPMKIFKVNNLIVEAQVLAIAPDGGIVVAVGLSNS